MNTANPSEWRLLALSARLVARLWQREVDLELLTELAAPPLRDEWSACGGQFPRKFSHGVVNELAQEYCRLFLGPRDHLPPYQSVWAQQQFHGDATVSTAQFRELLGTHAPYLPDGTPHDHLGHQLELWSVMADLADTEHTAGRESPETPHWSDVAGEFALRHLTWPEPLFAAVEQKTSCDFYRGLVNVTREVIGEIVQSVSQSRRR